MTADIHDITERMDRAKRVLKSGDGGGTYDAMEARVAILEKIAEDTVAELKGLRTDVVGLRVDVSEIKGRLSNMPTTWQIVALVFGILGGAFAIIKFGLH